MTRPTWELVDGAALGRTCSRIWIGSGGENASVSVGGCTGNLLESIDDQRAWTRSATSPDASDEHFAIAVGDEVGNVGLMVNALEGDHESATRSSPHPRARV